MGRVGGVGGGEGGGGGGWRGGERCELLPRILDKIISAAREIRNPTNVPLASSFKAKNAMKLNGVTDLSLQSRTVSTRSSILRIVRGSKRNLAPLTY